MDVLVANRKHLLLLVALMLTFSGVHLGAEEAPSIEPACRAAIENAKNVCRPPEDLVALARELQKRVREACRAALDPEVVEETRRLFQACRESGRDSEQCQEAREKAHDARRDFRESRGEACQKARRAAMEALKEIREYTRSETCLAAREAIRMACGRDDSDDDGDRMDRKARRLPRETVLCLLAAYTEFQPDSLMEALRSIPDVRFGKFVVVVLIADAADQDLAFVVDQLSQAKSVEEIFEAAGLEKSEVKAAFAGFHAAIAMAVMNPPRSDCFPPAR